MQQILINKTRFKKNRSFYTDYSKIKSGLGKNLFYLVTELKILQKKMKTNY